MLKFYYAVEKTNSYRPTPWHWSEENFAAYRGNGARYRAFLAVSKEYAPKDMALATAQSESYRSGVFLDDQPSKIIFTAKGTQLLVNCSAEEDERILMLSLRGGFRGGYQAYKIKPVGGNLEKHYNSVGKGIDDEPVVFSAANCINAQILYSHSGNIHCCPTAHVIARLENSGYVYTETGRRCSDGDVEVFSWEKYLQMPSEEFAIWREQQ